MKMLEETLKKKEMNDYDFGTGVWPIINSNVQMKLNDKGEFINRFTKDIDQFTDEELSLLQNTNSVFCNRNEDKISESLFSDIPDINYSNKIGYYLKLYAGHVCEGDYRKNASSGGFGTWIFKELLENNYIDGVIHVKESNSIEKLFEYDISNSIEEIALGAKTKYYPVEMSEVLKIVRKFPGKYAVIGVPSFVMDIRLLAEVDPIFKERIKFVVGLVCGHQKSTKFADFLAWQCGIQPGKLEKINFRKKFKNLPADSYGIEVTGNINGEKQTVVKKTKELFGYDWGQAFFKVRASDFTDDVMNETADITLGDAWLSKYVKDSGGNNIIIIRDPAIKKIIDDAILENRIKVDEISERDIISSQLAHFRHTQDELGYRLYKKKLKNEWYPTKRVHPNKKITFFRRNVQNLREKICIKAPVYFEEAVTRNDFSYFVKKMTPLVNTYKFLYFFERAKRKVLKIINVSLIK